MYNLIYEVVTKDDKTKTISLENINHINYNEKVLSFLDTITGQLIVYDFNNPELPIKEIKNIRIEKVEKN